jgi:hypothetical protein
LEDSTKKKQRLVAIQPLLALPTLAPSPSPTTKAEARRRSRINERLDALRRLVPHNERSNTAKFLEEAVDYVQELQKRVHDLETKLGLQPTVTPLVTPISFGVAQQGQQQQHGQQQQQLYHHQQQPQHQAIQQVLLQLGQQRQGQQHQATGAALMEQLAAQAAIQHANALRAAAAAAASAPAPPASEPRAAASNGAAAALPSTEELIRIAATLAPSTAATAAVIAESNLPEGAKRPREPVGAQVPGAVRQHPDTPDPNAAEGGSVAAKSELAIETGAGSSHNQQDDVSVARDRPEKRTKAFTTWDPMASVKGGH